MQKVRRDLRLVIASATIEAEAVAAFFDSRPNRVPEPLGGGETPGADTWPCLPTLILPERTLFPGY